MNFLVIDRIIISIYRLLFRWHNVLRRNMFPWGSLEMFVCARNLKTTIGLFTIYG